MIDQRDRALAREIIGNVNNYAEDSGELSISAFGPLSERIAKALADLRQELAAVTQDRDRLLSGNFTPEEFQNLCHNEGVQSGFEAFVNGCEAYQQKLFGRCGKGTTP